MRIWDYIEETWLEIIYSLGMTIYLFRLNRLNNELLSHNFEGAFELLQYRNCIAVKFFFIALFLFIVGCYLSWKRIKIIRFQEDTFSGMLVSIFVLIILVILLILLIIFIDNPILKAVLLAVLAVGSFISLAK